MLGVASIFALVCVAAPPSAGIVDIPAAWETRLGDDGPWTPHSLYSYQSTGWAETTWFRVVVDVPPDGDTPLLASLGSWAGPHTIWVDGVQAEAHLGHARSLVAVPASATLDGKVAFEVRTTRDPWVVRYGQDFRFGGGPLYLGPEALVRRLAEAEWSASDLLYGVTRVVVASFFWLVAAFSFWLHRRRREFSGYLWYGLSLLAVGAWMMTGAASMFAVQDLELFRRWGMAAAKLSMPAMIQFLFVICYRRQPSWPWRVLQVAAAIPGVALLVVGTPAWFLIQPPVNEIFGAVVAVASVGLVARATIFDRTARIIAAGFLVAMVAVTLQMATQAGLIDWWPSWWMPFAFVPGVLSMGIAVGDRVAGSLDDLDDRIKRRARAPATGVAEVVEDFDTAAIPAGTSIGPYRVLAPLGSGAMGVVYRAHDTRLDRDVALKLVQPEADEDSLDAARSRLEREAKAMARVAHPNLATIFDVGRHGDEVYFAMELIDGQSADAWLADGQPPRLTLEMFIDAGRGLGALHAAGLVHRDFKPANVMVAYDGRVLLLDFGVARLTASTKPDEDGDANVPSPGPVPASTSAGTPAYMAPEQHRGQPATGRSDQFSYCVAVYESVFGVHPFHGGGRANRTRRLRTMLRGQIAAPVMHQGREQLQAVLRRGLSAEPLERYPSMAELLQALDRVGPS